MSQPSKNRPSPTTKLEVWKLAAIDIFKSNQDRPHFFFSMTLDHAERPFGIQTTAKLPPEDIWLRKNFFERDDFSAVSCHQAQADLSSVRRRSQIVRNFFQ